jgi:FlaA1/EpsC-like NDP-sugar epimerase
MKNRRQFDIWFERACHLAAVWLSLIAAILLRFDFSVPGGWSAALKEALLIAAITKMPVFEWAGFYRGMRRFASTPDLYAVFLGNVAGSTLFAAAAIPWFGLAMPRSILVIDFLICFVATALVRFSARIRYEAFTRDSSGNERTGVLIYGAGCAGAELMREIQANRSSLFDVKGFLDDDPQKRGALILGLPVLGSGRDAANIVRRLNRRRAEVREIIIAMPSATGLQMREALANCRAARVACRTVPRIEELLTGKVLTSSVRNLSVKDLLGRKPVQLDETPVRARIAGRSILVTGAAGSIGSELCRQIARFGPARLVAFDQAESELFRIENELRESYPKLELAPALGDIRDRSRVAEVLARHSVEAVFHAAAYKHVPMMESHVLEAVRNNILGTWNLVSACSRQGVRSFLMISSDKAVNPVCVMGATKRVCERIVAARPQHGETRCVAVRFGNVLGSNGSVVPIFQDQIAAGGPVKVTHPDARRYFMTISEAVSLVVQAWTRSEGSEIFVLDMGEPIRIVDLAENMIRLAGLVPYEDVEIQFTGLRPGEKLIEEINAESEAASATYQDQMHIIHEEPADRDAVARWIEQLEVLIATRQEQAIFTHLLKLVPEYNPGRKALDPARSKAPGLASARPEGGIGAAVRESEGNPGKGAPLPAAPSVAFEQ